MVPRLASANPCAAKNPCGAKNPCNPCGAATEVTLTAAEASAVYDCMTPEIRAAFAKSGNRWAKQYAGWTRYNKQPYVSGTHGGRFVNNYANATGKNYGRFEKAGKAAPGTLLAKDSFVVGSTGRVSVGPLFLMEKMVRGLSGDWRYTLIMPNGATVGTTKAKGSANVKFCIACHLAVGAETDSMLFLPAEFRK